MENFRFILENYNREKRNRYACPSCGKHEEFTRYIDTEGIIQFADHVGKCNRVNKCGYHYTPAMYFEEHPELKEKITYTSNLSLTVKNIKQPMEKQKVPSFIDNAIMQRTFQNYSQNNLFLYLSTHFGEQSAMRLMKTYNVGSARKWGNSTVFWQVDISGRVHTGKIMQYDAETGKRIKEPYARVSWVHTELNLPDFTLDQCFFGEHLLSDRRKPVAIVESEKTALITSFYIPEYIWLATGGKNGCFNKQHFDVLQGRNVVLFPDLGATEEWKEKCARMRKKNIHVEVSDYLERNATEEERIGGYDIADYLIKVQIGEAVLQSMIRKNPVLQTLIDTFGLELVSFGTSGQ